MRLLRSPSVHGGEVHTGRIGYRGEDALSVTRRIVTHPDGLPFAPSDPLLTWGMAERRAGRGDAMLARLLTRCGAVYGGERDPSRG